ncbi:MAG TPA: SdrD B-like domain-containing protein, partial [Humisphaera sp.]|nr:SdrD B-like domain-containing protein [Humisphaera sp.]
TGDLPLDLIVDSTGNLFGITGAGGPGGYGTVFEIVSGTTAICNLMSFNFTNGARPTGGLSLDANGDFFGSTGGGGAFDAGEFFELTPIPSALSFTTPPVSTTVGGSLGAGAGVQASLLYSWGNPVSTDSSNITLTLSGGIFSTGSNTATIAAVSGIATFANLAIDVVGTYTLTATDGAIAPATSAPFTIAAAPNSVAGEVFNDANNNGALDSGEVGQATVNVTLTPTGATIGAPMTIATTGDGYYIFQNVSAGTYSVSESPPNGCALTAPIGGSAAVTVTAGQSSSGPTFGNVLISSVTLNFNTLVALSQDYDKPGTFANSDLNGDGMVDFSDLVLLSQNYNATLPSGSYTFTGASTLASSSAQTTTPAAPSPVAKTKAVTATASISGTVFNDVNGNSSRQSSEEGLSGRKVDLEIAGKGSVGQRTAITDSKGNFSFTNLPAGGYILIIPAPAGWRSTTAIASGDRLTLTSGEKTTSLRFGQQIIPPFTVTSTRVTDPLDHTKDLVTFYVRNNGVGATAGTRNLLAIDATLSSPGGLLIRTDDADGSGLLDDADFAGENTTPTASYIRIGGLAFVVASTTPAAKSDRYRDMQVVPSFEVAGILLGGVAANGASGTRIAAAIVTKGKAVTIVGRLGAEKGTLVPFSFTG